MTNPPEAQWRKDARTALADAKAPPLVMENLDRILDDLHSFAQFTLNTMKKSPKYRDVRDHLEQLATLSRKISRLLLSLTPDELSILYSEHPYRFGKNFEEEAISAASDQWMNDVCAGVEKKNWHLIGRFIEPPIDDASNATVDNVLRSLDASKENDGLSLPENLQTLADICDRRIAALGLMGAGGSGPGTLADRLQSNGRKMFIARCGSIFFFRGLPITGSETGPFFRFCAAIYDAAAGDVVLNRDSQFKEVVQRLKELRQLSKELNRVDGEIDCLPTVPDDQLLEVLNLRKISNEAMPRFAELSEQRSELRERIDVIKMDLWGA